MIRQLRRVSEPNPALSRKVKRLITITSEDAVRKIDDGAEDKDTLIAKLKERILELNSDLTELKFDLFSISPPNASEEELQRVTENLFDTLKGYSKERAEEIIHQNYNMYAMSEIKKENPERAAAIREAITMYNDFIKRPKPRKGNERTTPSLKRTSHEDIRPDI